MILQEIVLGKTEESKRDAIRENLGEQVILNDDHNNWCHGIILNKGYDNKVYQMIIADKWGQIQLHYNDLNQLLVISDNFNYRKPEID